MAPITISDEAKRAANLRVLQRIDSRIIDIVGSATHVVLYEFNTSNQAWEKRNCEGMRWFPLYINSRQLGLEPFSPSNFLCLLNLYLIRKGSLFLVKRSDLPRFNLIVMNRSSTENLVVAITSAFQMQVREPYLIFRMDKGSNTDNKAAEQQKIRGIWFHDAGEREAISKILDRIVKTVATYIDEDDEKEENKMKKMSNSEATATLLSALNITRGNVNDGTNNSKPKAAEREKMSNGNDEGDKELLRNIELDKKSLQLSLMSLLQDERFLDLIHAQYIKVVRARKKTSDS